MCSPSTARRSRTRSPASPPGSALRGGFDGFQAALLDLRKRTGVPAHAQGARRRRFPLRRDGGDGGRRSQHRRQPGAVRRCGGQAPLPRRLRWRSRGSVGTGRRGARVRHSGAVRRSDPSSRRKPKTVEAPAIARRWAQKMSAFPRLGAPAFARRCGCVRVTPAHDPADILLPPLPCFPAGLIRARREHRDLQIILIRRGRRRARRHCFPLCTRRPKPARSTTSARAAAWSAASATGCPASPTASPDGTGPASMSISAAPSPRRRSGDFNKVEYVPLSAERALRCPEDRQDRPPVAELHLDDVARPRRARVRRHRLL